MTAPELWLHVGFQQTGAGMLRRALRRVRPQLHEHGIGLIGHGALVGLPNVAGWRCRPTVSPESARAFERELAGLVERELSAVRRTGARPRAVLMSSDHLLGRDNLDGRDEQLFRPLAETSITQVIQAVRPSRVRVVMYLRRQDRLMEACYLRALQHGGTHRFEEQFPRAHEPTLDYGALLGRLEGLPEVTQLDVRPFELVGGCATTYVEDLLVRLELRGALDLAPVGDDLTPYRLYSSRAADIALEVNAHLDSAEERRLVRTFLLEHFGATDDAGTRHLGTAQRQRILESYASVNRRLFAAQLPDLPAESYASDEATARLIESGAAPAIGARDVAGRRAAARRRGLRTPVAALLRLSGTGGRRRGEPVDVERGPA